MSEENATPDSEITVSEMWAMFDKHCLNIFLVSKTKTLVEQAFFSGAHGTLELVCIMHDKGISLEEIRNRVDVLKSEVESRMEQWMPKPEKN